MRARFILVTMIVLGSAMAAPATARPRHDKRSGAACLDRCRKIYDRCVARARSDGNAARMCVRLADDCEVKCGG